MNNVTQTGTYHMKQSNEPPTHPQKRSVKKDSKKRSTNTSKAPAELNDNIGENSLSYVKPEDIFLPRDIDLNDVELDEFERELEAFKRFCFNSVPLKERVRVQLKDSNWFQRLSDNHFCQNQHQRSQTRQRHINGNKRF